MLLHDKEAKAEIAERWDESSESYDSHYGQAIQTDEKHDARISSALSTAISRRFKDSGCWLRHG